MTMKTRTAVILFNLGGPDKAESIAPFLKNFFMDPLIIRAPLPVRFALSRLIAYRRSRNEAGKSYGAMGGASPLLANSQAQARALESILNNDANGEYRTFVCMRYWHPLSEEVARAVKAYGPDRIVLLPLYPQYSTTTTESSFRAWDVACNKVGLSAPTARVCCYPRDNGFIVESARLVRAAFDKMRAEGYAQPRVLFSAHGLPEKVVKDGDPYQWQCEDSARSIASAAGLAAADWVICYQSRVGPMKWIGPSTEEEIRKAGAEKTALVVYPHAFVNEHVETIVEIGEEYRELAHEVGVPAFERVDTVGTGASFINGLAALVRGLSQHTGTFSGAGAMRICPHSFSACRFSADNERKSAA